jgi:hypothetical protein
MSAQPQKPERSRDQDAHRASQEIEKRHQEAIQEIARKNEAVQREGRKTRMASDKRKADIRRKADL